VKDQLRPPSVQQLIADAVDQVRRSSAEDRQEAVRSLGILVGLRLDDLRVTAEQAAAEVAHVIERWMPGPHGAEILRQAIETGRRRATGVSVGKPRTKAQKRADRERRLAERARADDSTAADRERPHHG
jgi:hypothetical protein